jgi:hypothetical protein
MYRVVYGELWTDPKVRALPANAKLVFLYSITNPHAHLSGIYYLPLTTMQHETGLDRRGIEGALKGLLASNLIHYDASVEQIWVVNMLKYQGRGQKIDKNVVQHLLSLHQSSLIPRFVRKYPHLTPYFPDGFLDTPSKGDTQNPSPVPDPVLLIHPNPDVVKKEGSGEKTQPNGVDDIAWIRSLKETQAYAGLDIDRELGKCKTWCDTNHQRFSRRRFVNWINRAERPIQAEIDSPFRRGMRDFLERHGGDE